MFIPEQSDGGFRGSKPEQHAWGGAAVTTLVDTPNSDIVDGKIKPGAAPAQLYDLKADRNQTKNLFYEHPEVTLEMAAALKAARPKASAGQEKAEQQTIAFPGPKGPGLANYDDFEPLGNIHYSFESGTLDEWQLTEGKIGQAVTAVPALKNWRNAPFARHGGHHLSTLVVGDDDLSDHQTGVLQSPAFQLVSGKASFLVSGGFNDTALYVALIDEQSGDVLIKAGGSKDHRMRRIVWDVSKWKGRTVRFQIVDHLVSGWGHLNVDDISVQGEPVSTSGKPDARPHKGAAKDPAPAKRADVEKMPNFVIIFADDLGYGDISCYNPNAAATPNLDQLAAEGIRSTDFFIPANVCSPSRAALLTGRYPMRCGVPVARNERHPKYANYGFATGEITIPELLKPAGYRSLMVGKWHLGMEIEGSHPIDAGFDEHLGIPSNYEKKRGPGHSTLYRGRKIEATNVPFQTLTRRYTDEVVAFIEKQKDRPFLIFFSHHIPHTPHLPGKDFAGSSGRGNYGDVIQELDHSTGRVMKALADAGLDDNTLVVFTSDNGPGRAGSAGRLNGGKFNTMEGGHRVPGIFRWPGKIKAGQVSPVTMTSMDLLPLFSGLAGVDLPGDRIIDGKNIFPVLQGKQSESPHDFLYYYNGTNLQAVREGDWKLHLPRTVKDQPFWNKRIGKGNPLTTLEQAALFNLKSDIEENQNVAGQHPEVVVRLQKQAEVIRAELGDVNVTGSDQRAINLADPQER